MARLDRRERVASAYSTHPVEVPQCRTVVVDRSNRLTTSRTDKARSRLYWSSIDLVGTRRHVAGFLDRGSLHAATVDRYAARRSIPH